MMNYEVIFECNSINNKKIRRGELKFLERHDEDLYFMFGESKSNMKKRYYRTLDELREDYAKVEKLKEEEDKMREDENKNKNSKVIKEKNIEEDDSAIFNKKKF